MLRVLTAACVIALTVGGCGGSSGPKTTTITGAQAAAQEASAANWKVGDPVPNVSTGPYVIKCGGGVSTNGSCVFANNVSAAVRAAGRTTATDSMDLTVTDNPVACIPAGGGWFCHSRRSQVWVRLP